MIYTGKDTKAALLQFQDKALFGFTKIDVTDTGFTLTIRKTKRGVLELRYIDLDPIYFPR
jgi:hypothetical protein